MNSHALSELLARQHGFVLRAQARHLGLDRRAVARRIRRGDLVADGPKLLRCAGAPVSRHARLVAALLETGPDSVIAFDTASAFWGFTGFAHEPIHLVRPVGGCMRTGRYAAFVHGSRFLPDDHVLHRSGLRITSPTRTLFDLAMHTSPAKLARTVDSAWSMRLTDGPRLTRALDELRRSGRDGIERMEVIIDERGPDWIPPESGLEHRFHALLRDDGQAPMRLQVGIGDDTFIGRVDALDDDASVIVEIQSNRFHRSPTDVAADAIRRGRLEAQGYLVIEVWEDEIFHDPGPALARIRRARSRRAA